MQSKFKDTPVNLLCTHYPYLLANYLLKDYELIKLASSGLKEQRLFHSNPRGATVKPFCVLYVVF